jgi:ribosomal protein S18 acetylase RimI-like enzyme
LAYQDTELIGLAHCFQSEQDLQELLVLVHPKKRKQGNATALIKEAMLGSTGKFLLITDNASLSGTSFVKHWLSQSKIQYLFSEFSLQHSPNSSTQLSSAFKEEPVIKLALHKSSNSSPIKEILTLTTGKNTDYVENYYKEITRNPHRTQFDIFYESKVIGMLGIYSEDERNYIYWFNIHPSYQGRGFGTQALSQICQEYSVLKTKKELIIEVETENSNALGLYKKMGFELITEFQYYELISDR